MKKRLMVASVVVLGFAPSFIHAQAWSPDMAMLQKLESNIQPSAYPKWGYAGKVPDLTNYARYYAGYTRGAHRLIAGEFVLSEFSAEKAPGIYVVANEKKFPMIYDGACGVVHVVYDQDSGKILSLTCNGRG